MNLQIEVNLEYTLPDSSYLLLQIEAAECGGQTVKNAELELSPSDHFARIPSDEGIGERIWVYANGNFECSYKASVEINRKEPDIRSLSAVPLHLLPAHVVKYLMPSRYCPPDALYDFAVNEFGQLNGGMRIAAMGEWIQKTISYVMGSSNAQTSAVDTLAHREGVCRDFAHVLITLARASAIPARIVSVYAPGIDPPDFHAVAEVYLEGGWHMVDATHMASPGQMARIGVGRDAADISFLTAYCALQMKKQTVCVRVG